jgi:hypothetical protein
LTADEHGNPCSPQLKKHSTAAILLWGELPLSSYLPAN